MKLDHIFVSASVYAAGKVSCKTIPVHVSDHLPVMASLGGELTI